MSEPSVEILLRLAVALAVGLLIGLERGWEQRDLPEGQRFAGLRTYGLVSLLGAVAVILAGEQPIVFASLALIVGTLAAIGYARTSRSPRRRSVTGKIAFVLTFALGALAARGYLLPAASVAVVATLLLGFKPELHEVLRRIEREELLGTIRLLLISVVVLPILPNEGFGPWHALNPYRIWWMVVLIAGLSYLGYFAQRLWGQRWGILATAFFGGMVSSTAVTVDLARRSAGAPGAVDTLSAGILLASSIMLLRVLVIVAPVSPALVPVLAGPLGAAALVGFLAGGLLGVRARTESVATEDHDRSVRNPLDLPTALQFGLLLAFVLVTSRALYAWLGDRGLYVGAAAAGLADVDAITLSVAEMSRNDANAAKALGLAILIAVAVNTAVKPAIALSIGRRELGLRVTLALVLALAAGAWAYALV